MKDSATLASVTSQLLARLPLPPLCPTKPYDAALTATISSLPETSDVTKAVLHLLNDDMSSAHELAQAHEESMTANLTHAILHRREKDFWNSKWWLGRITHPTITNLHGSIKAAKRFVDEVEETEQKQGRQREKLEQRQWDELRALLEYAVHEEG